MIRVVRCMGMDIIVVQVRCLFHCRLPHLRDMVIMVINHLPHHHLRDMVIMVITPHLPRTMVVNPDIVIIVIMVVASVCLTMVLTMVCPVLFIFALITEVYHVSPY